MTAKARAEFDHQRWGVRVAISPQAGVRLTWPAGFPTLRQSDEPADIAEDEWLRLDEDVARALYEALGDHFGHSGNDTRALRRDYDAERGRVDKLIHHLTGGKP